MADVEPAAIRTFIREDQLACPCAGPFRLYLGCPHAPVCRFAIATQPGERIRPNRHWRRFSFLHSPDDSRLALATKLRVRAAQRRGTGPQTALTRGWDAGLGRGAGTRGWDAGLGRRAGTRGWPERCWARPEWSRSSCLWVCGRGSPLPRAVPDRAGCPSC